MGMTISEKILALHANLDKVSPGEYVEASVDWAMVHEELGTPSGVAKKFESLGLNKVWDSQKIVALLDHWVPAPTIAMAEIHKKCREFVKKYGIKYWYDLGMGICHQVMVEKGHVLPGKLIVGTDSHTIEYGALGAFATGIGATDMAVVFATGKLWFRVPETMRITINGRIPETIMGKDIALRVLAELGLDGAIYKSIEYYGDAINQLSIDGRLTLCNISVEAGAKTAIIPPDSKTLNYLREKSTEETRPVEADKDAEYVDKIEMDISKLEPMVAVPPSPANSKSLSEVEGTPIDQAFIGSCIGGKFEDLQIAAKILEGNKIAENVRLIVIPASREIFLKALRYGIIEKIVLAGGMVESPTCGPCAGGHLGVLGSEETAIATVSRNFVGRMGSPKAKVYLASAATVAASAIKGEITDPRKCLGRKTLEG